ncbi:tripartite tricarboxylate transporter substrate binding protein [Cellulosimicrobium funkei]|nr:tripartite tricarboxylate transporter substrate binding protein [Cellulosimicrobium funkei]
MKRGVLPSIALASAALITVPIAVADAFDTTGAGGPTSSLTIIVPGSAGGGYDSLAREAQQSLRANGISGNVQVVNVPGASGTVGLQSLVEMSGSDDTVLVVGSAMVGGIEVTETEYSFDDVTAITSATTDYPVLVLPESSPYATTEEFIEAWRQDPEGHAIGGGALGNSDHLSVLAVAEAVGIDPADVNYIAYSGGGEVLGSLLSGTVAAGVSGYGEISDQLDARTVRGIGITAPEPIDGIDMPTFVEQGIDVVTPNWRGFVAPPGLTPEEEAGLEDIFEEMFTTQEWADALARNQWEDQVLTGTELEQFIADQVQDTQGLLTEIGS